MSYFIINTIRYILAFIPVYFLIEILSPKIELSKNGIYNYLYDQSYFKSYHIDFSKLLIIISLNLIGFVYVNRITMKNKRIKMFLGSHGYKDITYLLISSLILSIFSGNVIMGKYDYEGFCTNDYQSEFDFIKLIENFFPEYYDNNNNVCIKSNIEIFLKRFIFYVVPFFIGINFTQVPEIFPFLKILDLNSSAMKKWDVKVWLVFFIFITFVLVNLIFHFIYYNDHKLIFYSFLITLFILIITFNSIRLRANKILHLHHYFVMLIIIPFINIHCLYECILLGLVTGIMTEGIGRWGFSPIWEDRSFYFN